MNRKRGVFVTEAGYERLREVFNAYATLVNSRIFEEIENSRGALLGISECSFDDFYVGLYALNIASSMRHADRGSVNNSFESGEGFQQRSVERMSILRALLDVRLPKINRFLTFDETLPDEFDVLDVKRFIFDVKSLIPYFVQVERFDLSCIWLEFGIYTKKGIFHSSDEIPFLDKKIIESDLTHHELADLSSNPWAALRSRYPVSALELRAP